jgi:hypothetical protein
MRESKIGADRTFVKELLTGAELALLKNPGR